MSSLQSVSTSSSALEIAITAYHTHLKKAWKIDAIDRDRAIKAHKKMQANIKKLLPVVERTFRRLAKDEPRFLACMQERATRRNQSIDLQYWAAKIVSHNPVDSERFEYFHVPTYRCTEVFGPGRQIDLALLATSFDTEDGPESIRLYILVNPQSDPTMRNYSTHEAARESRRILRLLRALATREKMIDFIVNKTSCLDGMLRE